MFKTITPFRLTPAGVKAFKRLGDFVTDPTIGDPNKTAWSRSGFERPDHYGETTIYHGAFDSVAFTIQIRERILPAKVIRVKMMERAADIEKRQGRKCGRKELAEIKEETIASLLPAAFIKHINIPCAVIKNYLLVGTSSAKQVDVVMEEVCNVLYANGIGGDLVHGLGNGRPTNKWLMNMLLIGEDSSEEFTLGSTGVLKGTAKAAARFKDMDLASRAVQMNVDNAMVPVELAVEWNELMTFSITTEMLIKRIKFASILVNEAKDNAEAGNEVSLFDSTLAIVLGTVRDMLNRLCESVGEEDEL